MHCQSGTVNAKVSERTARASQSSWKPQPALKGVSSTATIRPVMMHLLILIVAQRPWTPSYLMHVKSTVASDNMQLVTY